MAGLPAGRFFAGVDLQTFIWLYSVGCGWRYRASSWVSRKRSGNSATNTLRLCCRDKSLKRLALRVFATAGDFGHIGRVFAGFAAIVFALGCLALAGGMSAFLHF